MFLNNKIYVKQKNMKETKISKREKRIESKENPKTNKFK